MRGMQVLGIVHNLKWMLRRVRGVSLVGETAVTLTWVMPKCGANLVRHLTMDEFPDLFLIGVYKPDLCLANVCVLHSHTHTEAVQWCSCTIQLH